MEKARAGGSKPMQSKAPQGSHSSNVGANRVKGGVMPNSSHCGGQTPKPMKSGGKGTC